MIKILLLIEIAYDYKYNLKYIRWFERIMYIRVVPNYKECK